MNEDQMSKFINRFKSALFDLEHTKEPIGTGAFVLLKVLLNLSELFSVDDKNTHGKTVIMIKDKLAKLKIKETGDIIGEIEPFVRGFSILDATLIVDENEEINEYFTHLVNDNWIDVEMANKIRKAIRDKKVTIKGIPRKKVDDLTDIFPKLYDGTANYEMYHNCLAVYLKSMTRKYLKEIKCL